jgi:PKD repeat protein
VALVALGLALTALVSPAAGARRPSTYGAEGPQLGVMWDTSGPAASRVGIVPSFGRAFVPGLRTVKPRATTPRRRAHTRTQPRYRAFACPDATCNMTYHSGDLVIGPHTTYVIYWEPAGFTSVSANYHALIERYFTDVAADSGRATNVYATDTQYGNGTNNIQYQQTFGGAFTDTTAYPATASGCPLTDGTRTVTQCLTQTQQATEVDNFVQANSLPRGVNNLYFLIMPRSVETCSDDFTSCGNILNTTPNRYCAYHSWFDMGNGLTIWANEPYIGLADGHCGSGTHASPNGDEVDHELNPLSHEHNEIITDPTGAGWFDTNGAGENGDKCNFNFGTAIATNTNGAYNQLINHNPYDIQLEWDNSITGCSATYGALAPTAAFTSSPASPKALDPVGFDATTSASNNTGGYIIDYQWTFGDTGTGSGATPSHTYANSGTYTVTLTVKDDAGLTDTETHSVTVVKRATTTTYTGDTSGDYHDLVTLSGHLEDTATSAPLASKTVSFALGTQACSGVTNGLGVASCTLTLSQIPGSYTASASYAGDATVYLGSSGSAPFTIEREESTLAYTGPTVILAGASSLTVTGTLVEDGANDDDGDVGSAAPSPSGQTVTFTLGAQSCSGTTNAAGAVSCSISSVSGSTLGSKTVTASFGGDSYYLGSSDTKSVIVFAFPSRGAFALGNLSVAGALPTSTLTWWSDSWASLNGVGAGLTVNSFKGFAEKVMTLPTTSPASVCGSTFVTSPGNSAPPTSEVPSYMGVVVTHSTNKSGSSISGLWSKIVVVRTNPGYAPNPGHPGTGTIVATFCG